ncbi:MAG TPA: SOS response-associated peptidase family protein, partial [Longimicrobiales bacterium]|nr:SOS response-associated peptidase family protein [Longimicrobiales bacterium]
ARLPYHIRPAHGRPFAFAAIWDRWRDPRGEPLVSCAILTTDAAPRIADIHDRMPVILPAEDRDAWLDPEADPGSLRTLLRPYPRDLQVRRVSQAVNSVANEGPACLEAPDSDSDRQEPSDA